MTKRFKDIEVSADTGEVRLYTTDNDYTEYTSEKLLNLLNKQDQRIQDLEEENTQLCNFNLHIILDKKNKEINQLKMEKQVLTETLDYCKDIINHTNDSKRMKQLHKELTKVIKDD